MKTRNAVSLNPNPSAWAPRRARPPGPRVRSRRVMCTPDPFGLVRVVGQLRERFGRPQPKEPAELVVARHPALADPQDVRRGEVQASAVRALQALEEARVIVQRDRSGMGDPERVERVRRRRSSTARVRVARPAREMSAPRCLVPGHRAERVLVRDQVHPVHGDELLGERVGEAVVVGLRAGDSAQQIARAEMAQPPAQALADDS